MPRGTERIPAQTHQRLEQLAVANPSDIFQPMAEDRPSGSCRINVRLGAKFEHAFHWAMELHRLQIRKGSGIPYGAHLIAVAALVLDNGGDEEQAMAALLHDAVEDQGGIAILDKIRERFGPRVARIVEGCTDAVSSPKPPWRARKEGYLRHLAEADDEVKLVSCCDKLHNAQSVLSDFQKVGDALWSRFAGKKDGTLWYYRALAEAFKGFDAPVARELAFTVDRIEKAVAEKAA